MTDIEKQYIEYRIKYPSMTRDDLFAFFPNITQLEQSRTVKMALAEIKKRELDEALSLKAEKQLAEIKRLEKRDALKERAMEVFEEMLYSEDPKLKWDAAKELLRGDSARDTKLSEIKAEFEAHRGKTEESYPVPSGPVEDVE